MGTEARARLGLYAVLAMTLFSFEQVYAQGEYAGPVLLGMLIAAGLSVAARRIGVTGWLTAAASGVALVAYLSLLFRTKRTFYGLPTVDSVSGLGDAIMAAYRWSQLDFAPVEQRPGYLLLTVAALWIATTAAELATFRWKRPIVGVLPAIALFSLTMVLGTGTAAQVYVVGFLAALLAYWALEEVHRLRGWGTWVSAWGRGGDAEASRGSWKLARRMGAGTIAVALLSPLALPAIESGLVSWRSGRGNGPGGDATAGGPRELDLLVTLKPRLVGNSETEMFRVTVDQPLGFSYWRLASLGDFDGEDWEPVEVGSTLELDDDDYLPENTTGHDIPFPGTGHFRRIEQRFLIQNLTGAHVPAAVQAASLEVTRSLEGPEQDDLRVNPQTGEIRAHYEESLVPSMTYDVVSLVPTIERSRLAKGVIGDLGDARSIYLATPEVRDGVTRLLRRWTKGARTPYEHLVAIQDRLRSFTYTTDIEQLEEAASGDYLSDFLLRGRAGYCQQFATAFAVLARLLDYPARVSVGFLPGTAQAGRPGTFVVRGTHAHAWPEVYFKGFGWVPFEPTPRSLAAPPSYTTDAGAGLPAGTGRGGAPDQTPTEPGAERRAGGVPANDADARAEARRARAATVDHWKDAFARVLLVMTAGVALSLAGIPALKAWRTGRRYRRARGPADVAAAAFAQLQDEAAELALRRRPAESAAEYARRLAGSHGVPRGPALRLAGIYEQAQYGPAGISDQEAGEARRIAQIIKQRLWTGASWWRRTQRLFSPRSLQG